MPNLFDFFISYTESLDFTSLKFLLFAYCLCYTNSRYLYVDSVPICWTCQSHSLLKFLYFIPFLTFLVCIISTILGTNSLNSADVPLSNKQCYTHIADFFRVEKPNPCQM